MSSSLGTVPVIDLTGAVCLALGTGRSTAHAHDPSWLLARGQCMIHQLDLMHHRIRRIVPEYFARLNCHSHILECYWMVLLPFASAIGIAATPYICTSSALHWRTPPRSSGPTIVPDSCIQPLCRTHHRRGRRFVHQNRLYRVGRCSASPLSSVFIDNATWSEESLHVTRIPLWLRGHRCQRLSGHITAVRYVRKLQ